MCYNLWECLQEEGARVRRFFVSEIDEHAEALARERALGLELICFCDARRLEDGDVIRAQAARLEGLTGRAMHAPYFELSPCAIVPLIRAVAMYRMRQAAQVCAQIGARRMIVHSGYAPQVYFPEWFVPKSIEFWRELLDGLPGDFELMVENVLDVGPEPMRAVCDGVDDPRLRICLDVGHANAYSPVTVEAWISMLGGRIAHVHLHNNDGLRDLHAPLDEGSLDVERVLRHLDAYAPAADICIESVDALSCIRTLEKRGVITDEKSL